MMRLSSNRGVTIIEATIVLTMMAILTAAAAPTVARTVAQSRLTRAESDVEAIKTAINAFLTTFTVFSPAGFTSTGATGGDTIEVLVSDGDIPPLSATISGLGSPHTNWDDVVACCAGAVDVSFLENHLVANASLGGVGSYSTAATGWKGAYINAPVDPDPWGNRYAVNTEYLRASTANDVIVLSAGPDETVDTQYSWTTGGARPGGDDIITVIRRDSGVTTP
jgi:type II secretory pathway pseudopilin PulG